MFQWFKRKSPNNRRTFEGDLPFSSALPPRRSEPPLGADIQMEHPEFIFRLPGDWVFFSGKDPLQFSWESKSKKTSIVISVMPLTIKKGGLIDAANRMLMVREHVEIEQRHGKKVQFGEKWTRMKDTNDVAEIAYAGFDENGLVFRYFGFVTQRKALSLWVATSTDDSETAKRIAEEAFKGLKFYVP